MALYVVLKVLKVPRVLKVLVLRVLRVLTVLRVLRVPGACQVLSAWCASTDTAHGTWHPAQHLAPRTAPGT